VPKLCHVPNYHVSLTYDWAPTWCMSSCGAIVQILLMKYFWVTYLFVTYLFAQTFYYGLQYTQHEYPPCLIVWWIIHMYLCKKLTIYACVSMCFNHTYTRCIYWLLFIDYYYTMCLTKYFLKIIRLHIVYLITDFCNCIPV
jgi:hypothetical protein